MLLNLEAPVGGWNAFNALDSMPPQDAVKLVNWIPDAGFCRSRGGSREVATDLGGSVDTLVSHRGSTPHVLLAAANGNIWDVNIGGSPASLGSGFGSDRWQETHHSGRTIFVNGVDTPQVFDGTTLSAGTYTAAGGEPTLDETTFIQANVFKGRVFYVADDDSGFWYTQAGSFQGEMRYFDLTGQTQSGGELLFMLTWTRDGGDGIDDLAVFVFSTGEILVYQGDDPQDILSWAMKGRFRVGEPLGRRSFAQVGGDNILLTKDGWLNLSAALSDGRYSEASGYGVKIVKAAKEMAVAHDEEFGWEAVLYPRGALFVVNVPLGSGLFHQHVRNTNTGSWCRFEGWNAQAFEVHDDALFFGLADGRVFQGDVGTSDDGDFITFEAVPAYQNPTQRSRRIQLTAAEMVTNYTFPNYITIEGLADYDNPILPPISDPPESPPPLWDEAEWDISPWSSGETQVTKGWQSIMANGYAVTANFRLRSRAQKVLWYSINYLARAGGTM